MTREERALPGELFIRLLMMVMFAIFWAVFPFYQVGRGFVRLRAWVRNTQWALDLSYCAGFAAICAVLLMLD